MALPAGATITWYGHSCIRIDTAGGRTVLIDPWFGNPKSPMSADAVERCDLLLVTHGHYDHMGDALALASRLRPTWPCMHEMSLWLGRQLPGGADAVTGMNKGGTVEAAGLRVTMTGADHSAGDWNAGGETTLYLGEPAGFVIELEDGYRIYHAGDTQAFGDMALIRELHRPDLAMLPDRRAFHDGPDRCGPRGRAPRRAATSCRSTTARSRSSPGRRRNGGQRSLTAGSGTSSSMRRNPAARSRATDGASVQRTLEVVGVHPTDRSEHAHQGRAALAPGDDHAVLHARYVEVQQRAFVADRDLAGIDRSEHAEVVALRCGHPGQRVTGADLEAGVARQVDAGRQDLAGRRLLEGSRARTEVPRTGSRRTG